MVSYLRRLYQILGEIRPSKMNKVFLIQAISKLGEGGPYFLLFFTSLLFIHFCVKLKS